MAARQRSLPWIGLRLSVVSNRYAYPLYAVIEREHKLLRDEAAVVISIALRAGPTAQDIVRETGRPKNSISRAVRKLEADGLIERRVDATDARAARLHLARKGKASFSAIKGYFAERDRRMLATLSDQDRQAFDRILMSISDASDEWM